MRRFIFILFTVILSVSIATQMEAQSLMQTAKKAEQRAKELKQQESALYNSIVDSKDLTKYNQYIADYPRGKNTPEIKKRAEEIKLWNNAKTSNTISAYENYVSKTMYHWFDADAQRYITLIRQAHEKAAWDAVKAKGTILAYQQFLKDNPNSGYRVDAEKAINRLQGANAWLNIKNTDNIWELEKYISQYPNADEITAASRRLQD